MSRTAVPARKQLSQVTTADRHSGMDWRWEGVPDPLFGEPVALVSVVVSTVIRLLQEWGRGKERKVFTQIIFKWCAGPLEGRME